jgi:hypothetical protein
MVARPDARMVEVPLEIEAELPRDFEGAALLSSSGLPRKVKIKAQRDALKLSTAYRADQLLADVVRTVLRGSPIDVERVQIAAKTFVRAVRERRQDGATLTVESNGRGRIQVTESIPQAPSRPSTPAGNQPVPSTVSDRVALLEKRVEQLEAKLARTPAAEDGDRLSRIDKRIAALEARPQASGVGEPPRGVLKGRGTAIDPFAEGFRAELRDRLAAHRKHAQETAARCDKAAALSVEAERALRAPQEGLSKHLLKLSADAAARVQALERVLAEIDLYAAADLPLAERLVARLVEGPVAPDATGPLERQAQALIRAARTVNPELRAWLTRAAALCAWELIDPAPGEPLSQKAHVAVDSGGDRVARVAAPGVRRKDGRILCRARVQVSAEARAAEVATAGEAEEVELLAEELIDDASVRHGDDTPPPIDDRTPTQPLPEVAAQQPGPEPEPTRRLAMPHPPAAPSVDAPAASAAPTVPTPKDAAPAAGAAGAPAPADAAPAAPPPAAVAEAAPPTVPPAQVAPAAAPERQPGPPLALGDGRPAEQAAAQGELSPQAPQPPPVPVDGAAKDPALAPSEPPTDDALALAAEVVAAVETETDEDPEWAQLARGPQAFPAPPLPPDVPHRDGKDD